MLPLHLAFVPAAVPMAAKPRVTSDATLRHMAGILGYLAYGFMVLTVLWGLVLGGRFFSRRVHRTTLHGGHMTLAILAITTSVLHAMVHLFRADQHYGWRTIALPWYGGAATKVSIGIVGLELLILVAVSIWLQRRLTYRRWHRLHWLAYPGFALVAGHVLWATKEKTLSPLLVAVLLGLVLVGVVALVRITVPPEPAPDARWFDVVEEQFR